MEDGPADLRKRSHAAGVGAAYGVAAYLWWGLAALYFKAVAEVPSLEIVAHRIVWSCGLLHILILCRRSWREWAAALVDRRTLAGLLATSTVIAANWSIFVYAVVSDQLIDASLGYFINPLVYVLLGFVLLRERLRWWQWFSVLLAAVGVAHLTITAGGLPWISLVLALTFSFYGLLRKTLSVDSLGGLTIEMTFLLPVALAYLVWLAIEGQGSFAAVDRKTDLLLMLAGVVTATPLLWFVKAVRRLQLATVGILQYLAPTGQFLLAVVFFGEEFTRAYQIAFACIWTALVIYSVDAVRNARSMSPVR